MQIMNMKPHKILSLLEEASSKCVCHMLAVLPTHLPNPTSCSTQCSNADPEHEAAQNPVAA
jgi:hypothetical protein